MSEAFDYLITSSESDEKFTACLWNYSSQSGNALHLYKNGNVAAPNTLNQIGNDFLITADKTKPMLHAWPMNSQEQIKDVRLILPGPAGALAVSPDNSYIAVGIDTKLYVWQRCNGKLLTVQEKHLLKITCVKFSQDSNYLVTASENGAVIVYEFGDLIQLNNSNLVQNEIGQVEPLYCLNDHVKAVTDVHIGGFGLKSRIVTVSLDGICRVYELYNGHGLLNVVHEEPLTAIVVDQPCWNMFFGTNSGLIRQFSLVNPPRITTVHTDSKENEEFAFIGHSGRINCLCLNFSNQILVSGSNDFSVIVWNIVSRQMLNKIEHKGIVTNVKFIMRNENLFAQNFKPKFFLKELQRTVDLDSKNFVISVLQDDEDIVFSDDETETTSSDAIEKIANLEEELAKAKAINKKMYALVREKVYGDHIKQETSKD